MLTMPFLPAAPAEAVDRARALAQTGSRRILGLVGAPGAGKSTLAAALQHALGDLAVVIPMDGYHLAQSELDRLGRAQRKGAPDTFDASGYVHLLQRLRDQAADDVIYAPMFDRTLEQPIAGAIGVHASTPLIITEGNYLLMNRDDAPNCAWHAVRPLLDQAWYVDIDAELREQRLVRRHIDHGRSIDAAQAWVAGPDAANALRIVRTRHRADWTVSWD